MFTINGEQWNILLVDSWHPMLECDDGSYTLGSCNDPSKTIFISLDIEDPHLFKKVLCHEIVHAAMYSYDVYLTYDQEEILADLIATYGEEIVSTTNEIFSHLQRIGDYY